MFQLLLVLSVTNYPAPFLGDTRYLRTRYLYILLHLLAQLLFRIPYQLQ